MGGRGAASRISDNGIKYGQEYHTLLYTDNIKFVALTNKRGGVPQETMSADRGRVYAFVDDKGILRSICFYARSGKIRRQIDLTHTHKGEMPHIHIGSEHSTHYIPLTKSDKAYIRKVERLWQMR